MRSAGGKGSTFANLYRSGFPVPDGFIILPDAFRDAIHAVRRSRHSASVQAYSRAYALEQSDHEISAIVQRLIPAELSGVLCTADPLTGDRTYMTGRFVAGLGDKLVAGETNASTFTFERPKGVYNGPAELDRFARSLYQNARMQKMIPHFIAENPDCCAEMRQRIGQANRTTLLTLWRDEITPYSLYAFLSPTHPVQKASRTPAKHSRAYRVPSATLKEQCAGWIAWKTATSSRRGKSWSPR